MPRAGSGGSHSSGGHSSSRSSGGHRVSSSASHSRAGSGHSSGVRSSRSSYSHGSSSYHRRPTRRSYSRSYRRTYSGGSSGGGCLTTVFAVIILLIVLPIVLSSVISTSWMSGSASIPASTRNREKLNSGVSFNSRCIVDEIDWFDSPAKAGARLKTFYDKTGVQPYIVLLKYHPELVTDSQKEDYALDYYENNIDNEAAFLYMYFAEKDQDNDVGYMCYVNGKQVDSVMDDEAIDIFWAYLDRNWYTDMSTDDLFENAFTETAETIMKKSKTTTDIAFVVVIGIVIIGIIIAVIAAMNTKRKNERERAEETQRILNTPLPNNPLSSQETVQTNNTNQNL